MSTFAGSGTGNWIDGAGASAAFNQPSGVAVDAFGNVLVADSGNHRVRRVTQNGGARLAICDGNCSKWEMWHLYFMFRALRMFCCADIDIMIRFQRVYGRRVWQLVLALHSGIVLPRWHVHDSVA